jgi:hypothetical protein
MPIFTPMNADGSERLKLNPESDIEILDGELYRTGPGVHATILLDGERFNVEGRVCTAGRQCFCDAQLVPVPQAAAAVQ